MAATPPAAHKAMTTLAPPIDRRSGTANIAGLLNISFLPQLAIKPPLESKDTFTTLLWTLRGFSPHLFRQY
jgi:hypothetical protein